MSNSRWDAFIDMLAQLVQRWLPEKVRRFVLYELQERVCGDKDGDGEWEWNITFKDMYHKLKD